MPKQVVIENPILNSPFDEPERHFHFDEEGITNIIVEVSRERDADKVAKVATARNLWIPAVNNAPTWGRWAFVEISDPWDAKNTIRAAFGKKGQSA